MGHVKKGDYVESSVDSGRCVRQLADVIVWACVRERMEVACLREKHHVDAECDVFEITFRWHRDADVNSLIECSVNGGHPMHKEVVCLREKPQSCLLCSAERTKS